MRSAAEDIAANVAFMGGELPRIELTPHFRDSIVTLCSDLESVLYDVRNEFKNLEDKLGLRPGLEPHDPGIVNPDPRVTLHFIRSWLEAEIFPINALVRSLLASRETNAKLGLACALVAESSANILTAYATIAGTVLAIETHLAPSASPAEHDHLVFGGERKSILEPELIDAFHDTRYAFTCGEESISLEIGQCSLETAKILAEFGAQSAAFITAANPFSRELSTVENTHRNVVLAAEALAIGLRVYPGEGLAADGAWSEPSMLLVGASIDQANRLADKHQQNAFVWVDANGLVSLVLRR